MMNQLLKDKFPFLSQKQIHQLNLFYRELRRFKHILITKKNPSEEIKNLIEEGIVSGRIFLEKISAQRIVDVGSGAGFPGIILAILSRRRLILVEPSLKRSQFLLHCKNHLELNERIEVRVETLGFLNEKTAVFKAFAPFKKTLKQVKKYLPEDACTYHFKSENYKAQWAALSDQEKSIWKMNVLAKYVFRDKIRFIIKFQQKI